MYPGIVLGLIGAVGMLLLGSAIWVPGRGDFAVGLLCLACCGMVIAAFQAIIFSLLAHEFAISEGLLPPRMTAQLLRNRPVFEYALIGCGGSARTRSCRVGGVAGHVEDSSNPQSVDATTALRLGTCSVAVCVVGLQLALGGAFMSVLRIERRGSPLAVSGADRSSTTTG